LNHSTSSSSWEDRGRSWWSHVQVLADDAMEGRETGSAGYLRAADYVAEQFRAAGLEPAGTDGFRQPVDFQVSQLREAESSLSLVRNGVAHPIRLRETAQFAVSSETVTDLEAEAVFVGYGLEIPEWNYSDLTGVDLRGKIAVLFRGGPAEIPGPIKAHYQSLSERYRALRNAGAVGLVQLMNPTVPDLPWPRLATGLLFPRMQLRDVEPGDPRPLPLAVAFNPDRFDLLLEGSGHTAAEVMGNLGRPGPLPRFPLAVRMRAHVEVRRSPAHCCNVVGVLRGNDPSLQREYVVGSAHLDHLGIGEPINGDRIYSGAMDNGSGVATLIEIARLTKASGTRPKRSMVFLAVTGEEKGLLGSEHFARHPTLDGRIVANLNMDMFLPLFPFRYVEVQGLGESSLGPTLRSVAQEMDVETHAEYVPDRTLFIRSDQYNFVKVGVPSLMISIGYTADSPEEAKVEGFFRERYHAPADDIDQPIDPVSAAQFTELLRRTMVRVANDPQGPSWNPDSFFRKFAK
jgi:hypothetical protein